MVTGRKKEHRDGSGLIAAALSTLSPSAGRRERRAAELRLRIFRAAVELIAKRGLNGVTVEQITEAADVGKGTFFNYFPTKEHVLGVMADVQSAKIEEAAAEALKGGETVEAILRRMVQRLAGELSQTRGLLSSVVSALFASEEVRTLMRSAVRRNLAMIATVISEGQKRGEISTSLASEEVARQMVRSCWGTVMMWALFEETTVAESIERNFEMFWRAIATESEGRS